MTHSKPLQSALPTALAICYGPRDLIAQFLTIGLITIRFVESSGRELLYREIGPGLPYITLANEAVPPEETRAGYQLNGRVVYATRIKSAFLPLFLLRNFSPENL